MKKVRNRRITLTHFSDILRMCLLYQYGGLWMDATIYVSQPIGAEPFCKQLFTLAPRLPHTNHISRSRWTGYLIGGDKGGPLFDFAKNFFWDYWEKEKRLLDYFLIDYIIDLAYIYMPEVSKEIDSLPTGHSQIDRLAQLLNAPFDEKTFGILSLKLTFHKLSYKQRLMVTTKDGKETFYGHLLALYHQHI